MSALRHEIGDDEPIPLAKACEMVFYGEVTPATLRAEYERGNLELERIGKKDFVTMKAIREMRDRCRRRKSRPDCTSEPREPSAPGSSETANDLSAQDALSARVSARLKSSKPTSRRDTGQTQALVVPFTHESPTSSSCTLSSDVKRLLDLGKPQR